MNAAQIQALIDAVPPGGGTAFLPPGTHTVERPLRVNRPGVSLSGDPGGGTTLATAQNAGMPTVFVGPTLDPPPRLFDGRMSRWVNLRDTYAAELDGLASLSVAFDLVLDVLPPAGDDQVILSSGGSRGNHGEYTQSLRLSVLDGRLRALLTTASGPVVLLTPVAAGSRHVALSYDGTAVLLAVDGVTASAPASGAVRQGFYEDLTVGSDMARWPDLVSLSRPITGSVTNFVLSGNGAVIVSVPSFVATDQLVACTTSIGPATLLLRLAGVQAGVNYCGVRDLTIQAGHGHGLLVTNCQNSRFERLFTYGRQSLTFWNNAYKNVLCDCTAYANFRRARYGLCLLDGTLNVVRGLQVITAGVGIVASSASGGFEDCFVYGGTMRLGLLAKGDGGWLHWVRGVVTDEGQGVPGEASLLFSGLDTVLVEAGGSYMLQNPVPPAALDHVGAATFLGHQFGVTAGAPSVLALHGGGKVLVQSSRAVPAGLAVPWAADPSLVVVSG